MRTQEYTTPSGQKFILRELTGEDDDIINAGAKNESEIINKYVANCISSGPDGKLWNADMVKRMRLKDKYFLLIASRILNLGPNLVFEWEWPESPEKVEYTQDLNEYVWDYSLPFPEPGDPAYFDQRLTPYPSNTSAIEFKIGNYQCRLDFLDGLGEEYLLGLKPQQKTVNSELKARNLSVQVSGEYQKVQNFASFSQLDMMNIRAIARAQDPQMEGLVSITNPFNGAIEKVPLLAIKDFFYPVKV